MVQVPKKEIRRICRNALFGAGLRILIGLLKLLLKVGPSAAFLRSFGAEFLSLNPLKWGAFVAGLSSFRVLQRNFDSIGVNKSVSAIFSGVAAGLPVLVFEPKTRTELMLYFLARVLHFIGANKILPLLPQVLQNFSHYDVVVMMATSAEILYSFMFLPKCHLPSYQAFLLRATMSDARAIAATGAAHRCTPCPELVAALKNTDPTIPDAKVLCSMYHEGMTCNVASARFLTKHFGSVTMPLYFPLKLISTAVFHSKKLLRDPAATLLKVLTSAAKSAAFLTIYCASSMRIICMFSQMNIRNDVGIALLAGVISGATILIEDKPRRLDLAIYCLMQCVRSTTLLMYHKGVIPLPGRSLQSLIYLACISYLYSMYAEDPKRMHPSVSKMFSTLLGEGAKIEDNEPRISAVSPLLAKEPRSPHNDDDTEA